MKILNNDVLHMISGAGNIVVTQLIPTEGLSDTCVAGLIQAVQSGIDKTATDEEVGMQILAGCTFAELDILGERIDFTPPNKIEYL